MRNVPALVLIFTLIGLLLVAVGILTFRLTPTGTGERVLVVDLGGPLYDHDPYPVIPFLHRSREQSLSTLTSVLRGARRDRSLLGVRVTLNDPRMGLAKAQELRSLFSSLQETGKYVDCFLDTAGEGTNGTLVYYLATACGHVSLAPAGDLNFLGLFADTAFFRGTLDKLKVDPDFSSLGEFKSAAEVYTESRHSPPALAMLTSILDDLFDQIVAAVAQSRGLAAERVRELVDAAPLTAREALAAGLVDELAYPDQFENRRSAEQGRKPRAVPVDEYSVPRLARGAGRLALVFAQGPIVRGEGGVDPWSGQPSVGSRTMSKVLRGLADREEVAAVVLRIDSPGGSAIASDLIQHEVESLVARKPVIVSMSDLAASGGYYIAAKAHKIVASPATLTGSIGVVGGKLVTGRFQEDLLGITHDTLLRGADADIYSPLLPFSARQQEKFEALMQRHYETFVSLVADGRNLSVEEVEESAQGRVWTGRQALERSLVDAIGGLELALDLAREAAGLPPDRPVAVEYHPRPPDLFDLLSGRYSPGILAPPELLERLLKPSPRGILELPREFARLNRPG